MRLGVIGHPIAHSLSPVMHTAALSALGRADVSYEAIDVRPDALEAFVASGRLDGFNVTLPHKRAIVPLLSAIDDDARAIGAVNTVVREDGRLVGTNTDARGFARSLEDAKVELRGARALVLGAGGAARAVAFGLSRAGARSVAVAARREDAAKRLVASLGLEGLSAHALDQLTLLAPHADVIVQATSAMHGPDADALAERIPFSALPAAATVVDLVYRPRETAVLSAARARGLRVVDGTGMLVRQGALALERWIGVASPVEVMRSALDDALEGSRALGRE